MDRRLHPDLLLDPYDWTSVEGRIEFFRLMAEFEDLLELAEPSDFVHEDYAMWIYVATGGSIGIVSKYLSRGLEIAVRRGLPRIDRELLAEVYASWHPQSKIKTKIDFSASLADVAPGVTLDDLVKARRRKSLDGNNNPSLCSVERCGELWELRMAGELDVVEPISRKLKASGAPPRGRGPKEPEGFRA